MAIQASNTSVTTTSPNGGKGFGAPLATVTTLFFMWGFLTCLNDILVPHLKSIFDLTYAQVMLVQFAFFGAYFIFSLPSAKIIVWIGYHRSMVLGLLTMGVGAFLFVPAASAPNGPAAPTTVSVVSADMAATVEVETHAVPQQRVARLPLTIGMQQPRNNSMPLKIPVHPKIGGPLPLKIGVDLVPTDGAQPKKQRSKAHRSWFFFS